VRVAQEENVCISRCTRDSICAFISDGLAGGCGTQGTPLSLNGEMWMLLGLETPRNLFRELLTTSSLRLQCSSSGEWPRKMDAKSAKGDTQQSVARRVGRCILCFTLG
jgi:hypothetical protein